MIHDLAASNDPMFRHVYAIVPPTTMLTDSPMTHTTATAEIALVGPGRVEQRYLADAQFTQESVKENLAAVSALSGADPYVLLSVFPPGMRVNLSLMDMDLYRDQRLANTLRALAVVTDSEEMHTASKLYFLYHQQAFPTRVFEDEFEALAWLDGQTNTH